MRKAFWQAFGALALLILPLFGHAQDAPGTAAPTLPAPNYQYGKVELADLDPKLFAQDTGASAVVLLDFGRTYFTNSGQGGFQVVTERLRRVKILNDKGFNEATLRIKLYRDNDRMESLQQLKGTAYNIENGKLVKTSVKGGDAVTTQLDANHSEKRLTLTGVKAGSIIEFSYQLSSDFVFNLPEWWFQEDIPVRWSEYRVQWPSFFDYTIQLQGYAPLQVSEQKYSNSLNFGVNGQPVKIVNLRWVGQNMPAFQSEAFITTPADYMTHVQFQLRTLNLPGELPRNVSSTWKAFSAEMMLSAYFGGVLGSVGDLDKPLAKLKATVPDLRERATAVIALVRENMAFNGDDAVFASGSMRTALERHRGNAAEVNLLLVSALRAAGLPADPVIVSTRDHGTLLDDEPVIGRFNYVLALTQLPDQPDAILDATDAFAATGTLPERCLNTRARTITNDEATQRWVVIKPSQRYVRFTSGNLILDDKGGLKGELHQEFSGYAGQRFRRQAQELTAEQLLTRYARLGPDVRLVRHELKRPTDLGQAAGFDLEITTDAEPAGTAMLYLPLKDFGGLRENPLRQPERQYPVDLGAPMEQKVMLDIQLPEAYQVETLPAALTLRTPDGAVRAAFTCTAAADGRSIQIMSLLSFTRGLYAPTEYAALRTVYEKLVSKHAEPLVLKRKS